MTSGLTPKRALKLEEKERQLAEKPSADWSLQDSKQLYMIQKWGEGYFDINEKGHVCVRPQQSTHAAKGTISKGPSIDLKDVLDEVKSMGLDFPVVLRFQDVLRSRVIELNKTFRDVMAEAEYQGHYHGVYPVKVNQLREVVEEIVDAGKTYNYGLEAGSKPELMVALSMPLAPGALTILNGYKDEDYLRLALLGTRMGRRVIVVIEKFSELTLLLKLSEETKVEPIIGLRSKLSAKGAGKWANSSGDKAKFGLTIPEIVSAIELLKQEDKLHWLKLFHFHIGSQVPDIKTIKGAISEGARIYCKMVKMGAPMEYFDVGGGAGVNYLGSSAPGSDATINYSLKDYVSDVVYIVKQVCNLEDVMHPHLVSESGRAITAYHSCLVTNVFGSITMTGAQISTDKKTGEHIIVSNLRELYNELQKSNVQEIYNDALLKREEATQAFTLGVLDLEERAKSETLYNKIMHKIMEVERDSEDRTIDLDQLTHQYSQQYLCNFSVFQSVPDTWGIGQVLPIMPITRHLEKPEVKAAVADITCDSDGKIDQFLSYAGIKKTSYFHQLKSGEEYFLGIFLTGAYQDIMGDMHNLFGRVNEVHLYLDDDDPTDFYIEETIRGNSAQEVLSTLQYSAQAMAKNVKNMIDLQVKRGKIRPREGVELCDFYEKSLNSYTYLKH